MKIISIFIHDLYIFQLDDGFSRLSCCINEHFQISPRYIAWGPLNIPTVIKFKYLLLYFIWIYFTGKFLYSF